jgi:hypothetical protein
MATQPKPKPPQPEPEPPEPGDPADPAVQSRSTPEPQGGSRPMTFGERAVGLTFNPSGDPTVTVLKQAFASIIDLCEQERKKAMERRIATQPGEAARLWSIAITEAQGAQMWAVKAATWKD